MRLKAAFHRHVLARRWLTFVVMGAAFLLFGAGSLNIIYVLRANLGLIADYGWMALMDGAGAQLMEILVTGYVSMGAYIVFKVCEYSLVHNLIYPSEKDAQP